MTKKKHSRKCFPGIFSFFLTATTTNFDGWRICNAVKKFHKNNKKEKYWVCWLFFVKMHVSLSVMRHYHYLWNGNFQAILERFSKYVESWNETFLFSHFWCKILENLRFRNNATLSQRTEVRGDLCVFSWKAVNPTIEKPPIPPPNPTSPNDKLKNNFFEKSYLPEEF